MERSTQGSEPILNKTVPELPPESRCKLTKKKIIIYIFLIIILGLLILLLFLIFSSDEISCDTEELANTTCPRDSSLKYRSDLSDFFTGSELSNKWFNFNPTFLGRRKNTNVGFLFASNNVEVSKGCLRLKARKIRDSENKTENIERGFSNFSTSIVKSRNKFSYGYFEIRAKIMKENICNSFWLYDPLSDNLDAKFKSGNTSEEIDIFQLTGKENDNGSDFSKIYYSKVQVYNTPYLEGMVENVSKIEEFNKENLTNHSFADDFHVYGFLWTKDKLEWYLDDERIFSRTIDDDEFNRKLHVTFDSEIFENRFGIPNLNDAAEFLIDYFRYWEKTE